MSDGSVERWRCPSCGGLNPPGSDSCQVCGRHLHVAESTGTGRADPLQLTWALAGFAVPLAGLVASVLARRVIGTGGGYVTFAIVQVVALLPGRTRRRPAFLVGWLLGLAMVVWSAVGSDG